MVLAAIMVPSVTPAITLPVIWSPNPRPDRPHHRNGPAAGHTATPPTASRPLRATAIGSMVAVARDKARPAPAVTGENIAASPGVTTRLQMPSVPPQY